MGLNFNNKKVSPTHSDLPNNNNNNNIHPNNHNNNNINLNNLNNNSNLPLNNSNNLLLNNNNNNLPPNLCLNNNPCSNQCNDQLHKCSLSNMFLRHKHTLLSFLSIWLLQLIGMVLFVLMKEGSVCN